MADDDRLSSHARPLQPVELGGAREVRSALEWAQVRAMAADGVSQREIASRLGINRPHGAADAQLARAAAVTGGCPYGFVKV